MPSIEGVKEIYLKYVTFFQKNFEKLVLLQYLENTKKFSKINFTGQKKN